MLRCGFKKMLYPSKVQLIMAKHLPGDLRTKGKAGNLKNMRLNLKGFFWGSVTICEARCIK